MGEVGYIVQDDGLVSIQTQGQLRGYSQPVEVFQAHRQGRADIGDQEDLRLGHDIDRLLVIIVDRLAIRVNRSSQDMVSCGQE